MSAASSPKNRGAGTLMPPLIIAGSSRSATIRTRICAGRRRTMKREPGGPNSPPPAVSLRLFGDRLFGDRLFGRYRRDRNLDRRRQRRRFGIAAALEHCAGAFAAARAGIAPATEAARVDVEAGEG